MPQRLPACKALTERRYIFLSRGGLVQRAPLQTQSVRTILTMACTNCKCLPEIATSAYGLLAMTNLVAGAVGGVHRNLQLPMALTERRYSQTWRRIRSAMPFPFRQCLPEIATAPLGPRNDKLEGLAPQNMCRKDCQPAWRSLSAATLFSRAAALYNERRYRRNRYVLFYRCLVRATNAFPRLPRRPTASSQ